MSVRTAAAEAAANNSADSTDKPVTATARAQAMQKHEGEHAKLRREEQELSGEMSMVERALARMDALEAYGEHVAEQKFDGDTRVGRAAQTGTVLTVVTLGITILVGILIYSQIQTSLPSPSNNDLANASQNSTSTFADAMELAPVIMIILLAAVVLAVVQRFR